MGLPRVFGAAGVFRRTGVRFGGLCGTRVLRSAGIHHGGFGRTGILGCTGIARVGRIEGGAADCQCQHAG